MSRFAHLHVHSEYSILDGLGRQKDYLTRVQELGQPAIAFTEHGSLRGIYKLTANLKKLPDPKPKALFGCELYVCNDRHARGLPEDDEKRIRAENKGRKAIGNALFKRETELGLRDRRHLTVIAKNDTGLRNLFRLTSVGWLEGFWKRPRVDLETLDKYGDGLIVLTGCTMGVVPSLILQRKMKRAIKRMGWFKDRFGDDLYLEIQPNSLPEQRAVNKVMALFAKHFGRPLVATADTHYVKREHTTTHELLLCVRAHNVLSNPNHFKFSAKDFWLRSRSEMLQGFAKYHSGLDERAVLRALSETVEIADKCDAKLAEDKFAALIPSPGLPSDFGEDEFAYLKHLCWVGWEKRDLPGRIAHLAAERGTKASKLGRVYAERLRYELSELKRKNMVRYFLVVADMYQAAREAHIECGPGRGSAAGCFVSFLLGITDVDSIEHGLLFERFMNPDRIDLGDIDCDFEDERRNEVIAYLRHKYGPDRVAYISTVTTMRGKGCVRDIGRVLEIPYPEVDACASAIVDDPTDEGGDIVQRAFGESAVCQAFDSRHPEVLEHARVLDGHARGLGIHASGVVVSPVPLSDVVPMEVRVKTGETVSVTGVEMDGVQALGLLKIDVLGLRNLTVIKHCLAEVKARHGVDVDLNTIDLNDPKVLLGFTKRNFVGVFQFDTQSAHHVSEGVSFGTFADVVALNALNRPGTTRTGLASEWQKRKADPSARKPIHPVVDRVCADTYGVIVYQEQVIRLLVEFAGFSPGKADAVRKKIGKSEGIKAVAEDRGAFLEGAKANGHDPAFAAKLFGQIAAAGMYLFNKAHACAYAIIALREMWLKTYYPAEFMVALLRCEKETETVKRCLKECRRLGVGVRGPHVNRSLLDFHLGGDTVVGSLVDVKGVGAIAAENIIEKRKESDYLTFPDFLSRVDRRKVNRARIVALAKAGALDSLIINRRWFLEHIDEVWKLVGRAEWKENVGRLLRDSTSEAGYSKTEATLVAAEVCPYASDRHPLEPYKKTLMERLSVPWLSLGRKDFWKRTDGFIYGMVTDVAYKRIGDYHTGEEPTEEEKKRRRWGATYAQVHIEDLSGASVRFKVDVDTFESAKPILDRGTGVPVLAHVRIDAKWKSVQAHFMVALDELRRSYKAKGVLTPFQRVFVGGKQHPVAPYSTMDVAKVAASDKKVVRLKGIVAHVARKIDKRGDEYAFIGLLGYRGFAKVLCFASSWIKYRKRVKVGDVVSMRLLRQEGDTLLLDSKRGDVTVLSEKPH